MKFVKYIFVLITAAFFCIMLGMFIGRNSSSNYIKLASSNNMSAESSEGISETYSREKGKVNINTADAAHLSLLPGVGEVIAQRIIDYRSEHGNYSSLEDLLFVEGIGEKKLQKILPYISLGG